MHEFTTGGWFLLAVVAMLKLYSIGDAYIDLLKEKRRQVRDKRALKLVGYGESRLKALRKLAED